MEKDTRIGLVELVEQLKSELGELQLSPSHLFTVEGVDLEIKFVVERSVDAKAKAQWVFFAAEAKGQYKDQLVNTIKLTLKPIITISKDGKKLVMTVKADPPKSTVKDLLKQGVDVK